MGHGLGWGGGWGRCKSSYPALSAFFARLVVSGF